MEKETNWGWTCVSCLVWFQFRAFIGEHRSSHWYQPHRPRGEADVLPQWAVWACCPLWNLPGDYWIRGLPSGGIWFYRIKTVILSIPAMPQCNHYYHPPPVCPRCHTLLWHTYFITASCVLHLASFDLTVKRSSSRAGGSFAISSLVGVNSECCSGLDAGCWA